MFEKRESTILYGVLKDKYGNLETCDDSVIRFRVEEYFTTGISILFQSFLYNDKQVLEICRDFIGKCLIYADKDDEIKSQVSSIKINRAGLLLDIRKGMNDLKIFVGKQEKLDKKIVNLYVSEVKRAIKMENIIENKIVSDNRNRIINSTIQTIITEMHAITFATDTSNMRTTLNTLIDTVLENPKKYRYIGK